MYVYMYVCTYVDLYTYRRVIHPCGKRCKHITIHTHILSTFGHVQHANRVRNKIDKHIYICNKACAHMFVL